MVGRGSAAEGGITAGVIGGDRQEADSGCGRVRAAGAGQAGGRQEHATGAETVAGVDTELAVPADKVRPLGNGRYELKVVIDAECQRGLDRLGRLLCHVAPHLGQLVRRLAREGLGRHDPGRPPRRPRTDFGGEAEAKPGPSSRFGSTPAREAGRHRHFGAETKRIGRPRHSGGRQAARLKRRRRPLQHTSTRGAGAAAPPDTWCRSIIFPYALVGRAEPYDSRFLSAAHHRQRHGVSGSPAEPAE